MEHLMAKNPCAYCGSMAQTGALLCSPCVRDTSRRLGDMEALHRELETTLTRQSVMTPSNDGGRSAETPVPFQPEASALASEQRNVLVSWCRLVNDEIDGSWPRTDTVMAMSLHLESRMHLLRKHDAAGELVSEIASLEHRILACVDYPDVRSTPVVGPCPEAECLGELIEHLPRDEGRKAWLECTVCRGQWDATLQLQQMATAPIRLSVDDIAHHTGIARSTITNWVSEGRITRYGDRRNYKLDLAEVEQIGRTRRRKAA